MRSGATLLDIEGMGGADVGLSIGGDGPYADTTFDNQGQGSGGKLPDTAHGRAAFWVWVGAGVWLFIVWRAVEGY